MAKVRGANGDDKVEVGCWLGKTDRADFHMVATAKGLKWTRTIRRLPSPFEAEALHQCRYHQLWFQRSEQWKEMKPEESVRQRRRSQMFKEAKERRRQAGVLEDEAASDPLS